MAEEQDKQAALTLEAIERDPLNAIILPLPANADRALLGAVIATSYDLGLRFNHQYVQGKPLDARGWLHANSSRAIESDVFAEGLADLRHARAQKQLAKLDGHDLEPTSAPDQDNDRPPTTEEIAERLKDHKGITGSMPKEQLAELIEHARAVPEISGNPDALNAFKADAAAKNAAHEAHRAAWTAQVSEAFANGTATVDKPQPAPQAAPEADPLPRSRDDIVAGARHAAREQAAAGGSKIDQYGLAMEAAGQQEAAAIPAHEGERAELAVKGAALEGSLAAAWAKIEARTVGGEQEAMLRAAMARVRGTDAPAAAIPPREGWQDRMAATLAGKEAQTPGEWERAALRARKAEAQTRSGQSRGFEP